MPRLALASAPAAAAAPRTAAQPPPDLCPGALLRGRAGALLDAGAARGAVVLGRRNPLVEAAVAAARTRDPARLHAAALSAFAPHAAEAEAVALASCGGDVLAAALDAARALTGRPAVVRLASTPAGALVDRLREGDVAAVLAEPLALETDARARLRAARAACDRAGVALVVDERLATPRWGPGGAQAALAVRADAAVYGAALANGHPFAALAGHRDLVAAARLRDPGAFAPTPEGLAAAAATALVLDHAPVCAVLRVRGSEVQAELEAALAATGAGQACRVGGDPTAVRLAFDHPAASARALARRFRSEMRRRGVLLPHDTVCVSYAWGDAEVSAFVDAARGALAALARGLEATARIARAA